jgi:hypothetical protein
MLWPRKIVAHKIEERETLPHRFESDAFAPEMTKLMKEAFEAAWLKVRLVNNDAALTRQLLASSIIDQVNRGARDHETIVPVAIAAMALARDASR